MSCTQEETGARFSTKPQSPLLGYSSNCELLQLVYDPNLWTALGSKKNLRDWRSRQATASCRSTGGAFTTVFFTMAPFEWSEPYHEFLKDEMQKLLRRRLRLAPFETLHLAHCMTKIVSGLLTGKNKQHGERGRQTWTRHVLSCKDESGAEAVVNFEFQDGPRKEATQTHHGSGRVHLHAMLLLDNVANIELEKVISATASDGTLGAYVRKVPRGQGWRQQARGARGAVGGRG